MTAVILLIAAFGYHLFERERGVIYMDSRNWEIPRTPEEVRWPPGEEASPATKKVKDIMSSNVVKISPGAFLEEAARLMKTYGVGMLPVVEGERVLGVVTDRDIAVRALAQGWNALLTEARVIMSEDIVWCFEDTPIEEASRLMAKWQIHRLLVFSREMNLAGVVSLDDIAVALRDEKALGQTLRDISIPAVAYHAAA